MSWVPNKQFVLWSLVSFSLITLSLPTIIIIGASFTAGDIIQFPPEGFSLRWYERLWHLEDFRQALLRTFIVSIICTLVALPVGTLAALATVRYRIRFQQTIQVYLLLPFTIPLVVSGIAMMIFFGEIRILGSLWPVGVALCLINLPFMIWSVTATVNGLDPELENAAYSCGAWPVQTFFSVTLPAVMPGVITGALLMFILAFNEFLVSLFLTDARTVTLPVQIYNSIRSVITPDLAAVSVLYIVIALLAIWLLDKTVGLEIFLKSK
ncbi:ABC transporter permease [Granulosicoccus antarcticus]|uniref:2-aminoethylphosphonate transport system permease protein PhnV n=1 Tax=Granulosicoccus antarcticus IMCC3135 TaxID=1192854 RepID=A0A2Z2NRF9_9GAMM|nr:ABC transporter permease [Granulosicoccus antarcticus]ASJ74032.1 Putative 2-aminoethylphosphonate transport system permease protein PhnV [Granulosicoccus antarcticus IMCC3135]